MSNKPFLITPKEHQVEHINKIINHLDKYHGYIEISPTGSGKTYITSYVANKLGLAMMVICPYQVKHTWDKIKDEQGAYIPILMTQGELRGENNSTLHKKFPFVAREIINGVITYTPTNKFYEILDAGVLLVIDEISFMKNDDSQITSAVSSLVYALTHRSGTKSRYVTMSAFMLDSIEQALTFTSVLGWYGPNTSLDTLIKVFLYLDYDVSMEVLNRYGYFSGYFSQDYVKNLIFDLMATVAIPKYSFSLPEPDIESVRLNSYFNMTDDEYQRYAIAVDNLSKYVVFDPSTGEIKKANLKDSGNLLKEIEMVKTGILIRETMKVLEEQPTSKVLIIVDSLQVIDYLDQAFSFLGVRHDIIKGEISSSSRYYVIDTFNEPNLKSRLIIATSTTIGIGLSLHDTHGGFPRTSFICQRFDIMQTYQASSRTIRDSSKSKPTVHIVYGKHYSQDKENTMIREDRIIAAINKKSKIATKFHGTTALYPSQYPEYYASRDNFNTNWRL